MVVGGVVGEHQGRLELTKDLRQLQAHGDRVDQGSIAHVAREELGSQQLRRHGHLLPAHVSQLGNRVFWLAAVTLAEHRDPYRRAIFERPGEGAGAENLGIIGMGHYRQYSFVREIQLHEIHLRRISGICATYRAIVTDASGWIRRSEAGHPAVTGPCSTRRITALCQGRLQ